MSTSLEPSGVLVISVWAEEGSDHGLRARLTEIRGLGLEQVLTLAASPEEILTAVRKWLEVIHGPPPRSGIEGPAGAPDLAEG
jgi:hypothetical protein